MILKRGKYAKSNAMKQRIKPQRSDKPVKFDWEALGLSWGIGLVCSGMGILIIWATMTDPEGSSESMGYTVAQRLTRALPDSVQEMLAFIFAGLVLLFGLICILLGFRTIVLFLFRKWKNNT